MQHASEEVPSGMMTVFLGRECKLNVAMHAAREYCIQRCGIADPVCKIANYLYPECKVIAGHKEVRRFSEREVGIEKESRL
jgi:[acyl-carrier-protein] S-malonyltransferase